MRAPSADAPMPCSRCCFEHPTASTSAPAAVPGLADVYFAINKQAPQHIYLSTDAQSAIIGELIPFGANPFAPARAKLKGAFGPSRGGPNSPIDVVEFSDLECPHCKKSQPVLGKLAADFPPAWQPTVLTLLTAWDQAARASSAVENWHSILRPHLAVHRALSADLLAILALWHNHRVAPR